MTKGRNRSGNESENDLQTYQKQFQDQASSASDAYVEAIALDKPQPEINRLKQISDRANHELERFMKQNNNPISTTANTQSSAISAQLLVDFIMNSDVKTCLGKADDELKKFLNNQPANVVSTIAMQSKTLKGACEDIIKSLMTDVKDKAVPGKNLSEKIINLQETIVMADKIQKQATSLLNGPDKTNTEKSEPTKHRP